LLGIDQIIAELIKHEVKHYILRTTELFILCGITKIDTAVEGMYYCTYSQEG